MNYSLLTKTLLFRGLSESEIETLLPCVGAYEKHYQKGQVVFRAGKAVTQFGLVESGSVNIVVNHYWGSSTIFGHVNAGDLFAETYAAIPSRELMVDVVATEDTTVLFLDMDKMLSACSNDCAFHRRIIHNLVRITSMKNLGLSTRMMHTAPKSIRGKLLSYLSEQAMEHGTPRFSIPFDRQQLADYLGVDRSALSNELSKMARDGLITYRKNDFELHANRSDSV